VLFVCPKLQADAPKFLGELSVDLKVRWLTSAPGRARQLNEGARASVRPYLWFLHADSRFTPFTLQALQESLNEEPGALHYFDLAYSEEDRPALMRLNELGAWWRSRLLGLPFGDQGFCLSRDNFNKLGGFSESVEYGEDHLLVWRAKELGIPLRATGAPLLTSPRKYSERGWARTTLKHQLLSLKQAMPEAAKLAARMLSRIRK
jgi:GT2 family glycosyltransferase